MKTIHNTKIIGINHGYGNMKTANCCFPTGITAYDHEPLFTADMLVYGGRYYLIGEGHKEFAPDKIKDEDYYVLTLAAIAKELKAENLTEAHIVVAAGLPLTWTSGQKADFKAYLMKHAEVEFVYKKTAYQSYCNPSVQRKKSWPNWSGRAWIFDFCWQDSGSTPVWKRSRLRWSIRSSSGSRFTTVKW